MTIIYPSSYFNNWYYSIKHRSTLRYPEIVSFRVQVLEFWNKYGLEAALEFARALDAKKKCSKSTLYRWRKALSDSGTNDPAGRGKLSALDPHSTRPIHGKLPRKYDELYVPIRTILEAHSMLGRRKIHSLLVRMVRTGKLLLKELGAIPSASTIGRIMRNMRELGRLPSRDKLSLDGRTGKLHVVVRHKKKKLRRNGYQPKCPGDLVQMDGVIAYCFGKKLYILNAIDYVSGKAISIALPNKKATTVANAIRNIDEQFDFTIKHIQTDNGTEFMAEFEDVLDKIGKVHFYNYVKKPQWNGKIERFNRTLQEEWLSDPDMALLLADDLVEANQELQKYLYWYNHERPHQALSYMTPCEYVILCSKGDCVKSQMS